MLKALTFEQGCQHLFSATEVSKTPLLCVMKSVAPASSKRHEFSACGSFDGECWGDGRWGGRALNQLSSFFFLVLVL